MVALLFSACGKVNYKSFVGTWGVEEIEYYNTDYMGNPIPGSKKVFHYNPNDTDNGIHLIFKEDKTGEMRDSAIDTIWVLNEVTNVYDSYIYCPDTTVVYKFNYSYDEEESILYMNMDYYQIYALHVYNMSGDAFIYENTYDEDYVEKAYLKRISKTPTKSTSRNKEVRHPHKMPGSLFGNR